MRRADRLLAIIQILQRRRSLITAAAMAEELEVSTRTIYRDMAVLMATGVPVEGEAGVGYMLREGYDLPPLMFGIDEIEAIMLGARLVAAAGDRSLARAAASAIAKIGQVLPQDRNGAERYAHLIAPAGGTLGGDMAERPPPQDLGELRRSIRQERKIRFSYEDRHGALSRRTVRPLALVFVDGYRMLIGWCELRGDFRTFRTDRMKAVRHLDDRFAGQGRSLLQRYASGLPEKMRHAVILG